MQIPPKQNNYLIALEKGWSSLPDFDEERIASLGAERQEEFIQVPVLTETFHIDAKNKKINLTDGSEPGIEWKILALHYLTAPLPVPPEHREVSFMDIPDARGYRKPYEGRVLMRVAYLFERDFDETSKRAVQLGGKKAGPGDAAYEFQVFPVVPIKICWFKGEEQLPPGTSVVYKDNISAILCVEDIVVITESVVKLLSGKGW
jgi:hypothetical protein